MERPGPKISERSLVNTVDPRTTLTGEVSEIDAFTLRTQWAF